METSKRVQQHKNAFLKYTQPKPVSMHHPLYNSVDLNQYAIRYHSSSYSQRGTLSLICNESYQTLPL